MDGLDGLDGLDGRHIVLTPDQQKEFDFKMDSARAHMRFSREADEGSQKSLDLEEKASILMMEAISLAIDVDLAEIFATLADFKNSD